MRKTNYLGMILVVILVALPVMATAAAASSIRTQMALKQAMRSFNKSPKALEPEAITVEVAHADTFLVGHRGPELTAFMDPNCIWCHRFYEKALPLIHAGKLHLRVVLVGFLKPTSAAKAAAVLMARHPAQALALDESRFNVVTEEGGIHPASAAPASIRESVHHNTQILIHTGEEATPTLLYLNKQNHWELQHGLGRYGLKKIMAWIR